MDILSLPYEYKRFSQSAEDGILTYLNQFVEKKTFLELGWSKGLENNCRNLIEEHGYTGTGVDIIGNKFNHPNFTSIIKRLEPTEEILAMLLELEGMNPGVFSIDIDSFDWHLTKMLIEAGFRPEVFVHEYNSLWGPTEVAIRKMGAKPQDSRFNYGASLGAFRAILEPYYTLVTCNSTGVNAFYIRNDKEFEMPEYRHEYKKITIGPAKNSSIDNLNIDDKWEYEI
jgi:hypothetical protein